MTDSGNYAARATALRETVKWVAAVFVGAGAILFSGLSFTNIEKIAASGTWFIPVLLAVIPVLAAAFAVQVAAQVISQGPPDAGWLLPCLVDSGKKNLSASAESLRKKVEARTPATVAIFGDIKEFEDRLVRMQRRVTEAREVYDGQKTPDNRRELNVAYADLADLQEGVRDLLLCADFIQVDEKYQVARRKLLIAAVIGILAAAGSGVAAARLTPTEKIQAAPVTQPLDVRVYSEHSLGSAKCPVDDGQRATAIGGTLARPLLLMPALPDNSQASAECHRPWRWAPADDTVVIVPQSHEGGAG